MYKVIKPDDIEFMPGAAPIPGTREVSQEDIEPMNPEETHATWQNIYKSARPYIQTALEGGGSVAGMALGSRVGRPIIGDALGYAAGAETLGLLDRSFGLDQEGSFGDKIKEAGARVSSGFEQAMGGQILGQVVGTGARMLGKNVGRLAGLVKRGVDRYKSEKTPMFSPVRIEGVRTAAGKTLSETRPQSTLAMSNRLEAEALEETMPGLKYTRGQKMGTPAALVLEDTLIRSGVKVPTAKALLTGEALSQTQKREAQNAILEYYSDKVDTGTVKSFMDNVFTGKNKLEIASTTAEKQARKSVEDLATKADTYTMGKQLSEIAHAKKKGSLAKATELYDKVPNIALKTKSLKTTIKDYVIDEDSLLEPRATKIVDLIKTHTDKPLINFQTLRKIRTRINRYTKAASSNPEDARQLKQLKELVNNSIDEGFTTKFDYTAARAKEAKESNKELMSSLVKRKALKADDWYRGTNISELEHIIDKKALPVGESFEGASGISAYKVTSGAPITMQGSYETMPVTIIGVKSQIEGAGKGVNEILVNPTTKPENLLYGINGTVYKYDEMVDFVKKYQAFSKVDEPAAASYKKASKYYREHAFKFKEGVIADVLTPGSRGEPSKIPYSKVGKHLFTKEGTKAYAMIAKKDPKAMKVLEDYANKDFYDTAYDPITDKLKPTAAFNWVNRNADTLDRLGMKDDFYGIARKIKTAKMSAEDLKDFVKPSTLSGKALISGPDELIKNVFSASKNMTETAAQLKQLVKTQPKAVQGLQQALSKHIIETSKITAEGFIGDFKVSFPRLDTQYKKYLPALKEVYKNAPKKLQALADVHKAFKLLHRDASSLVSAKASPYSMLTTLAKMGGAGSLKFPAVFAIKKITEKFSDRQIKQLLLRASFDPDYAMGLEYLFKSKTATSAKKSLDTFDGLMSRLTVYAAKRLKGEPDE